MGCVRPLRPQAQAFLSCMLICIEETVLLYVSVNLA